jgi:hypothetical protein
MALAIKYPKLSAGVLIDNICLKFVWNCSRTPTPSASLKNSTGKVEIYQGLFNLHYLIFECFNFSGWYFVRKADGSRILHDIQIFSSKKQPFTHLVLIDFYPV